VRFEVALLDTAGPPSYQRIARKAVQVRNLGLTDRVIARRLGVSDKTVAKAISWLETIEPPA
jgi:ribosomal protein L14E/L6E/L27E